MGKPAEINRFQPKASPKTNRSNSATHSTSTGGDPTKTRKAGGASAKAGKIKSNKRTTTRKRGR